MLVEIIRGIRSGELTAAQGKEMLKGREEKPTGFITVGHGEEAKHVPLFGGHKGADGKIVGARLGDKEPPKQVAEAIAEGTKDPEKKAEWEDTAGHVSREPSTHSDSHKQPYEKSREAYILDQGVQDAFGNAIDPSRPLTHTQRVQHTNNILRHGAAWDKSVADAYKQGKIDDKHSSVKLLRSMPGGEEKLKRGESSPKLDFERFAVLPDVLRSSTEHAVGELRSRLEKNIAEMESKLSSASTPSHKRQLTKWLGEAKSNLESINKHGEDGVPEAYKSSFKMDKSMSVQRQFFDYTNRKDSEKKKTLADMSDDELLKMQYEARKRGHGEEAIAQERLRRHNAQFAYQIRDTDHTIVSEHPTFDEAVAHANALSDYSGHEWRGNGGDYHKDTVWHPHRGKWRAGGNHSIHEVAADPDTVDEQDAIDSAQRLAKEHEGDLRSVQQDLHETHPGWHKSPRVRQALNEALAANEYQPIERLSDLSGKDLEDRRQAAMDSGQWHKNHPVAQEMARQQERIDASRARDAKQRDDILNKRARRKGPYSGAPTRGANREW